VYAKAELSGIHAMEHARVWGMVSRRCSPVSTSTIRSVLRSSPPVETP
jgi:hypothetical protein